jgi:hypothetical protein
MPAQQDLVDKIYSNVKTIETGAYYKYDCNNAHLDNQAGAYEFLSEKAAEVLASF